MCVSLCECATIATHCRHHVHPIHETYMLFDTWGVWGQLISGLLCVGGMYDSYITGRASFCMLFFWGGGVMLPPVSLASPECLVNIWLCGMFDPGISIDYLKQGFSSLGYTVTLARCVSVLSAGPKRPRSPQHDHSNTLPPPISSNSPTCAHTRTLVPWYPWQCCVALVSPWWGWECRGGPLCLCVCVRVFAVARALPLSYTPVFVCVCVCEMEEQGSWGLCCGGGGLVSGEQEVKALGPSQTGVTLSLISSTQSRIPSVWDPLLTKSDVFFTHEVDPDWSLYVWKSPRKWALTWVLWDLLWKCETNDYFSPSVSFINSCVTKT